MKEILFTAIRVLRAITLLCEMIIHDLPLIVCINNNILLPLPI